ncbi:hypothetical protein T484DRAFT_1886281 [Baffinella frigidus]|nr:hypothetical protein T484DRAFT_1886281 [Cryptophyta sp. CCMP2293]
MRGLCARGGRMLQRGGGGLCSTLWWATARLRSPTSTAPQRHTQILPVLQGCGRRGGRDGGMQRGGASGALRLRSRRRSRSGESRCGTCSPPPSPPPAAAQQHPTNTTRCSGRGSRRRTASPSCTSLLARLPRRRRAATLPQASAS